MKTIQITTKRRCCDPEDLVLIISKINKHGHIFKCQYCGDFWVEESYTDAAGGSDSRIVRWFPSSYSYEDIKIICGYGDLSY